MAMTKKEMFELLSKFFAGEEKVVIEEDALHDIQNMLNKEIERLGKSRSNPQAEEFALGVITYMRENLTGDDVVTAKDMAEKMGESPRKMSAALERLVKMDEVVKIPKSKSTDVNHYVLA